MQAPITSARPIGRRAKHGFVAVGVVAIMALGMTSCTSSDDTKERSVCSVTAGFVREHMSDKGITFSEVTEGLASRKAVKAIGGVLALEGATGSINVEDEYQAVIDYLIDFSLSTVPEAKKAEPKVTSKVSESARQLDAHIKAVCK